MLIIISIKKISFFWLYFFFLLFMFLNLHWVASTVPCRATFLPIRYYLSFTILTIQWHWIYYLSCLEAFLRFGSMQCPWPIGCSLCNFHLLSRNLVIDIFVDKRLVCAWYFWVHECVKGSSDEFSDANIQLALAVVKKLQEKKETRACIVRETSLIFYFSWWDDRRSNGIDCF